VLEIRVAAQRRSVRNSLPGADFWAVTNFHHQTFVIMLMVGPQNNSRPNPVRSAKTFLLTPVLNGLNLTPLSHHNSDVVEAVTFETETSSGTPRLETWNSRPRLQNCAFWRNKKKCRHHFWVEFFYKISGIFPTCFVCFLPEPKNTTNKKSLNYLNCTKPFLCNIHSLETCSLRRRDETWNFRDRYSHKWVSRRVSRLHHCITNGWA